MVEQKRPYVSKHSLDVGNIISKSTKHCTLEYENKSSLEDIFEKNIDVKLTIEKENHQDKYLNSIYKGDNYVILRALMSEFKNKVDLIYIDPPFGVNKDFYTYDGVAAYSDKVVDNEFLEFLRERLYLLREFLSDQGSLYLHIDKKIGHYVKIIMDEVFGSENYINEITRIKCNPKNFSRKGYGNISDTIFLYTKIKDSNIWNDVRTSLSEDEIKRLFPKVDANGERYTTNPLHAPGETIKGPTGQMWKGMHPPKGRHWRYDPSVLDELDRQGMIEWSANGNPRKIIFARDHKRKKLQDVWEYKDKGNAYTNYPTEKNHDMLSIIIQNSSNSNSIVMDAFMGSGSTILQAARHGRKFIGIDSSEHSIEISEKVLNEEKILYNLYKTVHL